MDMISNNSQLKKHKTTKISIITDTFNVPLDISVSDSCTHDSVIISNQIKNLAITKPLLCDNNNILIGDAAYDSSKLKTELKELKIGELISGFNNRNTKDPNKIRKHTFTEKMILKTRGQIEHKRSSY